MSWFSDFRQKVSDIAVGALLYTHAPGWIFNLEDERTVNSFVHCYQAGNERTLHGIRKVVSANYPDLFAKHCHSFSSGSPRYGLFIERFGRIFITVKDPDPVDAIIKAFSLSAFELLCHACDKVLMPRNDVKNIRKIVERVFLVLGKQLKTFPAFTEPFENPNYRMFLRIFRKHKEVMLPILLDLFKHEDQVICICAMRSVQFLSPSSVRETMPYFVSKLDPDLIPRDHLHRSPSADCAIVANNALTGIEEAKPFLDFFYNYHISNRDKYSLQELHTIINRYLEFVESTSPSPKALQRAKNIASSVYKKEVERRNNNSFMVRLDGDVLDTLPPPKSRLFRNSVRTVRRAVI